jgi:hypothetical protein
MTNKSLKDIVEYIQKYAVAPPQPSAGYAPSGKVPSPANAPASNAARYHGSNISKMQEALVSLAQSVTNSAGDLANINSFNNFMTKNYWKNSEVPSVSYNPTSDLKNTPNTLNLVMETMKQIVNSVKKFADGIWGPHTNASLINSYALASGLLKIANEFKVPVKSYNENYLNELKAIINDSVNYTPDQKNKEAVLITEHLQAIKNLYNEVKSGVSANPQWKTYIENNQPYIHYQNQGLTPEQLHSLQQTFTRGFLVPIKEGESAKIGVENLANIDAFNKWLSQFPNTKLDPYNVLTLISNQISRGA